METPLAPILQLPQEIQLHFLRHLPASDLVAAMRTCRIWHDLAKDESLWRRLVDKRWQFINRETLANASSMRSYFSERYRFENNRCNQILYCSDVLIAVANPDGTGVRELRRSLNVLLQPTWDPFSRSIIWTEKTPAEFVIRGCAPDGSGMWTHPSGNYMPFYFYWLPDGQSCTYLGTVANPMRMMEMRRLIVRPSVAQAPVIARGRPCFWSFSPTEYGALVGRISESLVIRHNDRASLQRIVQWHATGMSPQWSSSGRYLLVSAVAETVPTAQTQNLVVLLNATDLSLACLVAKLTGRTRCMISRNERFVYYCDSSQLNLVQRARGIFQGSLHFYDMTSGVSSRLAEGPVIAYFSSPDSNKVIWIEETDNGSHVFFCWEHPTSRKFASPPVQLRDQFLEQYLPFFDQYAQSMTLFSPDSRAITFAAAGPSLAGGVYTMQLEPGATPQLIVPDPADEEPVVMACWSPT